MKPGQGNASELVLCQRHRCPPCSLDLLISTTDSQPVHSKRSYWLRRLENHGRKERVVVDEYDPSTSCRKTRICQRHEPISVLIRSGYSRPGYTLGDSCAAAQLRVQRPTVREKRDMDGGFRISPLKLNAGLGQLDVEQERHRRAEKLAVCNRCVAIPETGSPRLRTGRPAV